MASNRKKIVPEDLVEVFLDPRVKESLTDILRPALSDLLTTTLDNKLSEFNCTLVNIVAEFKLLQQKNERLVDENKKLMDENKSLRHDLDCLDSYSRRDDLIIHGLSAGSFADASSSTGGPLSSVNVGMSSDATEDTVVMFCREKLGLDVNKNDISVAHRLPIKQNSASSTRGPAPIMVRFTRRKIRDTIFRIRKDLRNTNPGVYVNEHLTPRNAELYKHARLLVKQKKLVSAWTHNCIVYVKDSEMPGSRPIKVNSLIDLPQ